MYREYLEIYIYIKYILIADCYTLLFTFVVIRIRNLPFLKVSLLTLAFIGRRITENNSSVYSRFFYFLLGTHHWCIYYGFLREIGPNEALIRDKCSHDRDNINATAIPTALPTDAVSERWAVRNSNFRLPFMVHMVVND